MADDEKKDIVHLGPELSDGTHPYLREQGDQLTGGFVSKPRRCREGEALHGSGIIMKHRGPGPSFNVVGEWDVPAATPSESKGPAKVTSDAYRAGWDNIFGKKVVGEA